MSLASLLRRGRRSLSRQMEVNADGKKTIEAAIEFGGSFSLDIIVAKGGVHVMAGIYFMMVDDDVHLHGYLRCGGFLEVLGIISISVEFYMELSVDTDGNV